jgi:hypothetical protein
MSDGTTLLRYEVSSTGMVVFFPLSSSRGAASHDFFNWTALLLAQALAVGTMLFLPQLNKNSCLIAAARVFELASHTRTMSSSTCCLGFSLESFT